MTISSRAFKHMKSPNNVGALAHPTVIGLGGFVGNGPFLRLYLRIEDDKISDASFETYSCPWAVASGSALTFLIKGRNVSDARALTENSLQTELDEVPRNKAFCPRMAIEALKNALS